jgi:toxin ParE1/3/4
VTGTYEKSVARLPYIIAYELRDMAGRESVVIVRVIHTSRDWPAEEWPH